MYTGIFYKCQKFFEDSFQCEDENSALVFVCTWETDLMLLFEIIFSLQPLFKQLYLLNNSRSMTDIIKVVLLLTFVVGLFTCDLIKLLSVRWHFLNSMFQCNIQKIILKYHGCEQEKNTFLKIPTLPFVSCSLHYIYLMLVCVCCSDEKSDEIMNLLGEIR